MSLAALIAPLAGRRCAVAYRIVPRADGQKADKIPIDPRTGDACNHMDPATWVEPERLYEAGWPVALVLHEALNMFCIDLDEAMQPDGSWSAFATGMCQAFTGAGVEISQSGRALHILGTADLTRVPAHRISDSKLPGLEIYTRNRFIALTGTAYTGDIRTDHTLMLQAAIAQYLPGEPGTSVSSEFWTSAPIFTVDATHCSDDDIVRILLQRRQNAHSVFSGGATLQELWNADEYALAMAYPTNQPNKRWNYNAADQALATHLSYFTGADCERTRRIMMLSKLRREKWEREDYMRRTIGGACKRKSEAAIRGDFTCNLVQQVPPPPPPAPVMDAAPTLPAPGDNERKAPGTWLTVNDQLNLFSGITYVTDVHQAMTTDGSLIGPQRFDVLYGGYEFQMTVDGASKTKSAWEVFTQSRVHNFPKVFGLYFDPRRPTGEASVRDNLTFVNSWVPIDIPRIPGDVSIFLQHLCNLIPDERDRMVMLSYMAFVAQCKGFKANWTPLLQGTPGNGKTFLSTALQYCVGKRYTHWPNASDLDNHFNAAFYGKLLICVDDITISEAKSSMWEALKPMITNLQLQVTPKGVDAVTREICFNFMLNSNNKNAIRKTRDDRRIAPFFCPQQHEYDLGRYGMQEGSGYFIRLFDWAESVGYAAIYDYLLSFQIPDEFHPLSRARRAPKTTSTEAAIRVSRGAVEQEVLEAIETGKHGFRNGWISSDCFDLLLVTMGRQKSITRHRREEILEEIGYQVHPDLVTGRVLLPDGSKPTLYVTREGGHPSAGRGMAFDEIAAAYVASQR